MTVIEFHVLVALCEWVHKGGHGTDVYRLAACAGRIPQVTSGACRSLSRQGLVQIHHRGSRDTGRLYTPTPKGRALYHAMQKRFSGA